MKHLTISDIYLEGNMLSEDARKTIYLTPTDALQYSNNTWLYHQCPTQVQWLTDIETQKKCMLHKDLTIYPSISQKMSILMKLGLIYLKN